MLLRSTERTPVAGLLTTMRRWRRRLPACGGALARELPARAADLCGAFADALSREPGTDGGGASTASAKGAPSDEPAAASCHPRFERDHRNGDSQRDPGRGERNPVELAKLRNGRIKASEATIAKSLVADYLREHLFTLRQSMLAYRHYQEQPAVTDVEIERMLVDFSDGAGPDAPALPQPKDPAQAKA
jgi:hypothetical protein